MTFALPPCYPCLVKINISASRQFLGLPSGALHRPGAAEFISPSRLVSVASAPLSAHPVCFSPISSILNPPVPASAPALKLLDFCLTHRKHSRSKILIDNFEHLQREVVLVERRRIPVGSGHSIRLDPEVSDFANFTYDFFYRHYVRLELLVSYRKQKTGPLSNRHKFTFFIFPVAPRVPVADTSQFQCPSVQLREATR